MRWIHESGIIDTDTLHTPRKRFNVFSCYRVFTSFYPSDPVDKREDVVAPTTRLHSKTKQPIVTDSVRLFYEGAEEELDRYLRWLSAVYLFNKDDDPAPIYVATQDTYDAQKDIQKLYPSITVHFISMSELCHYGLLVGPSRYGLDLGLY